MAMMKECGCRPCKEYQKSFDAGREIALDAVQAIEDKNGNLSKQFMVHGAFATLCQCIFDFGGNGELAGLFGATLDDLDAGAGKPIREDC
jgi:hypothetical protein